MKYVYLALAIIFTVVLLVLGFGNINAQFSNVYIFFYRSNMNPTLTILGVAILGMITGAFYQAFIAKLMESGDEEEVEI